MAEELWLDDRLPPLVEIIEPNRQQTRRITRRKTPCGKCFRPLTAEDLCFADGKDAHRSCAELWNHEIFDGWDTLKTQDAAEIEAAETQAALIEQSARSMGLALPNSRQEGALWTPPSATRPTPTLAAAATA
jgi:hypothetical protein